MNAKAHWSEPDLDIRQLLYREDVPEGMRNALLREQIAKLHALKDAETPGWRERPEPPVEMHTYACPHNGLDGMVRHPHRD